MEQLFQRQISEAVAEHDAKHHENMGRLLEDIKAMDALARADMASMVGGLGAKSDDHAASLKNELSWLEHRLQDHLVKIDQFSAEHGMEHDAGDGKFLERLKATEGRVSVEMPLDAKSYAQAANLKCMQQQMHGQSTQACLSVADAHGENSCEQAANF